MPLQHGRSRKIARRVYELHLYCCGSAWKRHAHQFSMEFSRITHWSVCPLRRCCLPFKGTKLLLQTLDGTVSRARNFIARVPTTQTHIEHNRRVQVCSTSDIRKEEEKCSRQWLCCSQPFALSWGLSMELMLGSCPSSTLPVVTTALCALDLYPILCRDSVPRSAC
jgi:hypothetical protein